MSPISILVVDDHPVFADALQARLSGEPDLAAVAVAYSAAQALAQVRAAHPDVVVLDLVLGEHDSGLDVAEAIRDVAPATRVIILTGVESVNDVVAGLALGVRAWLPKTVDSEHLIHTIRGVYRGEAWLGPELLGRVLTALVARVVSPPPNPLSRLTAREREVLQCMVDGLTRPEIAERLHMSINTVRTHTQNLIPKLGAHSTLESVSLALRNGLRVSGG